MRRVKNITATEDDWDDDDWGGGGWDDGWYEGGWGEGKWDGAAKTQAKAKPAAKSAAAKPAAKSAAAKPAAGKAQAKPKAAATTAKAPAAGAPKAAAAPAAGTAAKAAPPKPSASAGALARALGPTVTASRIEEALAETSAAEDAFLKLLEEELDGGRWGKAAPEPEAKTEAPAKDEFPPAGVAKKGAVKKEPKKGPKSKAPAKEDKKPAEAEPVAEAEPAVEEAIDEPVELPPDPADGKPSISLVVVGHVDAGKSTLMGHLLCLVGTVTQKTLHKFEKESKQMGKASFAYAWVLDEGQDERERGVTIDVCVKHFATENRRFTILDAPGHRDFVPNMLQGAVQADAALLVADVSNFDSGFERGGQTKEHLQLIRSLGIANLIVAVNKLDTHDWSEDVYNTIKERLHSFIVGSECGFKKNSVSFLPLSGFTGENMLERKEQALSWWKGPTLLEALDQLPPPTRPPASGPLRVCISDFYKTGNNICTSGKVEAGALQTGQKVVVLPHGEQVTVKSMQARGQLTKASRAGDYMDEVTLPLDPEFVSIGGVICDVRNPVPVTDSVQAQLLVFDVDVPMLRGQQVMCYLHTVTVSGYISKLEALVVKGKKQDKRPKCLSKGNVAIVQLRLDSKVCVEPKPEGAAPATSLSRLVLRDRGKTVAAGVVLAVS